MGKSSLLRLLVSQVSPPAFTKWKAALLQEEFCLMAVFGWAECLMLLSLFSPAYHYWFLFPNHRAYFHELKKCIHYSIQQYLLRAHCEWGVMSRNGTQKYCNLMVHKAFFLTFKPLPNIRNRELEIRIRFQNYFTLHSIAMNRNENWEIHFSSLSIFSILQSMWICLSLHLLPHYRQHERFQLQEFQ